MQRAVERAGVERLVVLSIVGADRASGGYKGRHQPIVTPEVFDQVQKILGVLGRSSGQPAFTADGWAGPTAARRATWL